MWPMKRIFRGLFGREDRREGERRPARLNQENGEDFSRTISLYHASSPEYAQAFKAILDAGCAAGDLITSDVVNQLGLWDMVDFRAEYVGICAHGHHLQSIGTILLRWEGRGLTKVFETNFHVIDEPYLPWQVIIGADTCARHHLLSVGVFMGRRPVQPDNRAEREEIRRNREKHEKDAADNKKRVDEHKKEKEERRRKAERGH